MDAIKDTDLFIRIDGSVGVAVSGVNTDILAMDVLYPLNRHEQVNPRPRPSELQNGARKLHLRCNADRVPCRWYSDAFIRNTKLGLNKNLCILY